MRQRDLRGVNLRARLVSGGLAVFATSLSCAAPAPASEATVDVTDTGEYRVDGHVLTAAQMCRALDAELARTHAKVIVVRGPGDTLSVANVMAFTGLVQKYGVDVRRGTKTMTFDGTADPSVDACAISDPASGE